MKRGQTVRPTAAAIALTRFSANSRLVVRVCNSNRWCVACQQQRKAAAIAEREAQGKPVYAHMLRNAKYKAFDIAPGSLYGAGKEQSSSLCLRHVEGVR